MVGSDQNEMEKFRCFAVVGKHKMFRIEHCPEKLLQEQLDHWNCEENKFF